MKKKYTGYPTNTVDNPVRHSDEYLMEQLYIDNFYSNKEFHIERVQKGKEIRNSTIGQAAIMAAITVGLSLGSIIHGNNLITDFLATNPTINPMDVLAIFGTLGAGYVSTTILIEKIKEACHLQTDIKVSEEMVQKLDDKETKGRLK